MGNLLSIYGSSVKGKIPAVVISIAALALLSGCAAGPNELTGSPDEGGSVAGFWHGLWHGFIVFFTFIISLFTDKVRIYDVHNSGNWYNFGFVLGAMMFFGGSCGGAGKKSAKDTRCGKTAPPETAGPDEQGPETS